MSDWQPIETAPKDGTSILVHFAGLNPPAMVVVVWNQGWAGKPGSLNAEWGWDDGDSSVQRDATHWMPLPEPPVIE